MVFGFTLCLPTTETIVKHVMKVWGEISEGVVAHQGKEQGDDFAE